MVPQTCQELVWNSLGWPDASFSLLWGIPRLVGAQEEKELVGLQPPHSPDTHCIVNAPLTPCPGGCLIIISMTQNEKRQNSHMRVGPSLITKSEEFLSKTGLSGPRHHSEAAVASGC